MATDTKNVTPEVQLKDVNERIETMWAQQKMLGTLLGIPGSKLDEGITSIEKSAKLAYTASRILDGATVQEAQFVVLALAMLVGYPTLNAQTLGDTVRAILLIVNKLDLEAEIAENASKVPVTVCAIEDATGRMCGHSIPCPQHTRLVAG